MAAADAEGLKRVIYLGVLARPRTTSPSTSGAAPRSRRSYRRENQRQRFCGPRSSSAQAALLRDAALPRRATAGHDHAQVGRDAHPAIAIQDVLAYLAGCLLKPETAGQEFDIGGTEIFTYVEMMQKYAEVRGLAKRFIIRVPVLTPMLSAYWVDLMTPIPSGIAHPLIEDCGTRSSARTTASTGMCR